MIDKKKKKRVGERKSINCHLFHVSRPCLCVTKKTRWESHSDVVKYLSIHFPVLKWRKESQPLWSTFSTWPSLWDFLGQRYCLFHNKQFSITCVTSLFEKRSKKKKKRVRKNIKSSLFFIDSFLYFSRDFVSSGIVLEVQSLLRHHWHWLGGIKSFSLPLDWRWYCTGLD